MIQTATFKFFGDYTLYGEFMDGGDGYWYGFSNEGDSSGNARMLWVKIKKGCLFRNIQRKILFCGMATERRLKGYNLSNIWITK